MKHISFLFILNFLAVFGFTQTVNDISDCEKPCVKSNFFVSTNQGLRTTPYGIKVGILGKTGGYIGARYGKGEIYHSDTDLSTSVSNLYSITCGINKRLYTSENFGIHLFAGAGYGQWFKYRWERWTKEGTEIEAGLTASYQNLILSAGANVLNGYKAYATWDFTVGLGYRF